MCIKNIFVSHYHSDAEKIENLKSILSKHGLDMHDSSIYEAKTPNNANNPDYIKSLIRTQIDWAGTEIVLIGKNTSESEWVNWEIQAAAGYGKRIIGVYLQGETDSNLPKEFIKYGQALVKWNGDSIINAINGDNTWDGPPRKQDMENIVC